MKNLNRKEYKKTIKEFRRTCPIAQIQHKWVHFKDKYSNDVLMYVNGSIVKRAKDYYAKYRGFKFGDFTFVVYLYGTPTLQYCNDGLKIDRYYSRCIDYNNQMNYEVLGGKEVSKIYNKIFDRAKYRNEKAFTIDYKQNE